MKVDIRSELQRWCNFIDFLYCLLYCF